MKTSNTTENGQPLSARKMIQESEGLREIPCKMKARAVMMTPAVARELLKNNHPRNRKLKKSRIQTYRNDILNGFWELSWEPVAIDEDGWLVDGQNRLTAIVEADRPAPIWLVTHAPKRALKAAGHGLARSVADAAKIAGEDKPNMTCLVGVARAMMYGCKAPSFTYSTQEVLAFIKAHEAALDFTMTLMIVNKPGITQAPVKACVARAWYHGDRERIKEFCAILYTGLPGDPEKDSGALRLRNWLMENFTSGQRRTAKAKPQRQIVYGKTQQALMAFLERRAVDKLYESSKELFPLPEEK